MDRKVSRSEAKKLALQLGKKLCANGHTMSLAESCTGGLLAELLTEHAGSSQWFDSSFVVYANEAKTTMLGVPSELIRRYGAVSEEVACAMVTGCRTMRPTVSMAAAVTGIAGPTGATATKPLGTVCFAWSVGSNKPLAETHLFRGSRRDVRLAAAHYALGRLLHLEQR